MVFLCSVKLTLFHNSMQINCQSYHYLTTSFFSAILLEEKQNVVHQISDNTLDCWVPILRLRYFTRFCH